VSLKGAIQRLWSPFSGNPAHGLDGPPYREETDWPNPTFGGLRRRTAIMMLPASFTPEASLIPERNEWDYLI